MEEIEGAEHDAIWTAVGLVLIVAVTTILIAGAYNLKKGMQGENLYHAHQLGFTWETIDSLSTDRILYLYPDDLSRHLVKQQRNVLVVEDKERRMASQVSYQLLLPRMIGITGAAGQEKQWDSPRALLITKIQDTIQMQEVEPTDIPTLEELEKEAEQRVSTKIKRGGEASAYG